MHAFKCVHFSLFTYTFRACRDEIVSNHLLNSRLPIRNLMIGLFSAGRVRRYLLAYPVPIAAIVTDMSEMPMSTAIMGAFDPLLARRTFDFFPFAGPVMTRSSIMRPCGA